MLSGGCAHPAEVEPPAAKGAKKAKSKGQRAKPRRGTGDPGGCRGLRVRLSAAAPEAAETDTLMLGGVGGGMGGMGGGMGTGGDAGSYWQLRAKPGLWRVALKSDRYELGGTHVPGGGGVGGGAGLLLPMADYRGVHLPLTIRDAAPADDGAAPPAKHTTAAAEGDLTAEAEDGTVHIFSLASGLLYERFLRTMMASVLQRTQRRVKFWLLSVFISPQFRAALPTLARELGCEIQAAYAHCSALSEGLVFAPPTSSAARSSSSMCGPAR